jgi:putative ABC transport system permease protein
MSILGVAPALGRDFRESDDVPGCKKVALISDGLWKRRFGGSADTIGKQIIVDGVPREIIGVLRPNVKVPRLAQIYLPLDDLRAAREVLNRDNHPGFSALGRLKPGVALGQATADLDNIARELERRYPDTNTGRRLNTMTLLDSAVRDYKNGVRLLFTAVICVLLIACANVANLQLARSLARDRELAVRAALGASRMQLARQVLTESTILALVGGFAGVMLSLWGIDAIKAISPNDVVRFQELRVDLPVLTFTALIAIGAGIFVGTWPAMRVSRNAALSVSLHEGGRGTSDGTHRQRARSLLVVAQVALALLLLAGAGLMLKSFRNAEEASLGFDPHGVVNIKISIPEAKYPKDEQKEVFWSQLLERVRQIPGVEAAAISANSPFDDNEWDSYFHVTGTPPTPPGQQPSAEVTPVSPNYFRVMGMPILRGRNFGPEDLPGEKGHSRSIIIDESFAKKYFAGKDPIGQHIDDNQTDDKSQPPMTIIGVVPRTRNEAPGEDNSEKLHMVEEYLLASQDPQRGNNLHIRTNLSDVGALVAAVKREVQAIDPDQALGSVSTMNQAIAKSLSSRRMLMSLLGVFAAVALLLASVGLYGVMALTVTQRTRELGIRLALGAQRTDVFRLVLTHGMLLVCVGLSIGLIAALGVGRGLQGLLYGVGDLDGPALSFAFFALAAVALVACWFPAHRATRVDPIIALRSE